MINVTVGERYRLQLLVLTNAVGQMSKTFTPEGVVVQLQNGKIQFILVVERLSNYLATDCTKISVEQLKHINGLGLDHEFGYQTNTLVPTLGAPETD